MIDESATEWFELHQLVPGLQTSYWTPHSRHPDMASVERARDDLQSIWPRNRYRPVTCRVTEA